LKFRNIQEVWARRLCVGCGACYYVCPRQKIELVDFVNDGIRPIRLGSCEDCRLCLDACPGILTDVDRFFPPSALRAGLKISKRWGRYFEIWEGFAGDPEIRLKGSSGGLCTALALFCMEQGIAGGTLHIGPDPELPWRNKTFLSHTRAELVSRTGSRYAPASPCDGLGMMEEAEEASVFVGKPCDVAALRMVQEVRPQLAQKTALAIGFFCAGTPSTQATLDLLKRHGIDPNGISEFKYRGEGWPGMTSARLKGSGEQCLKLTYGESWGFVQKYRPFRCYLCPDLTAEFADISVGDPWYREIGEDEPGRSLIIVRTQMGREIFHQALKKGYVRAEPAEEEIIYRSQENLLNKRQAIWGRLLAMKLLRIPHPRLEGFHLFENWLDLNTRDKAISILGTMRRIVQRNYFKPLDYSKYANE
jgi:coenzyme F420 hydrogenase subunit beta